MGSIGFIGDIGFIPDIGFIGFIVVVWLEPWVLLEGAVGIGLSSVLE